MVEQDDASVADLLGKLEQEQGVKILSFKGKVTPAKIRTAKRILEACTPPMNKPVLKV